MGAMSSEILHILKVKLPLQNDQRWLPLLSWFSKFKIERGPRPPLSEVCCKFYSPTLDLFDSMSKHTHKWGSTSLICDLLAKDLLYPLSVEYRGGKEQDPVKMLENSMLICSLFL